MRESAEKASVFIRLREMVRLTVFCEKFVRGIYRYPLFGALHRPWNPLLRCSFPHRFSMSSPAPGSSSASGYMWRWQ